MRAGGETESWIGHVRAGGEIVRDGERLRCREIVRAGGRL